MKKYSAILLSVLALGFASCEDKSDLGVEQINPQGPIFDAKEIVYIPFSFIDASEPTIGQVNLGYIDVKNLPEDYAISGTLQLSPNEDFSKVINVPLTCTDDHLYGSIGEIAAQYTEKFSLSPDVTHFYGRTTLIATNPKGEAVSIGNYGEYLADDAVYTFKPIPAEKVISKYYYIVMGDGENWDLGSTVQFNHSDINQYDDPDFSIVIKSVSKLGSKWIVMSAPELLKLINQENPADINCLVPVFDRNENGAAFGDLEQTKLSSVDAASLMSLQTPCEVSVNMKNDTFSEKEAVEAYYATGNGWSSWGAHWMPLSTTDFTEYIGFLNLESEFKFSPNPAWNGDFGAANSPSEWEWEGVYGYNGTCHDSGNNIWIAHPGLYFAKLNASTWNFALTQTNSWGLIGDFNGWGGDIELTPSADLYTWTGELTVTDGQGWKFRANHSWDINLGGQSDALWTNGDNIVLPEAGTYTITLDLSTYPAKFSAQKK